MHTAGWTYDECSGLSFVGSFVGTCVCVGWVTGFIGGEVLSVLGLFVIETQFEDVIEDTAAGGAAMGTSIVFYVCICEYMCANV